jgi:hypothetical protein
VKKELTKEEKAEQAKTARLKLFKSVLGKSEEAAEDKEEEVVEVSALVSANGGDAPHRDVLGELRASAQTTEAALQEFKAARASRVRSRKHATTMKTDVLGAGQPQEARRDLGRARGAFALLARVQKGARCAAPAVGSRLGFWQFSEMKKYKEDKVQYGARPELNPAVTGRRPLGRAPGMDYEDDSDFLPEEEGGESLDGLDDDEDSEEGDHELDFGDGWLMRDDEVVERGEDDQEVCLWHVLVGAAL